MNCCKLHLFVKRHNPGVVGFYEELGYTQRLDLTVMSKTLRTQAASGR
jgi:hypothetical protein